MQLHQAIVENQGAVPSLTLDEIIRDGKVTNNYQIFVLAWLSEYFKNGAKPGTLNLETPITMGSQATHADVVTGLKALTPEDQVSLASYLKDCIAIGDQKLDYTNADLTGWMYYVLARQD